MASTASFTEASDKEEGVPAEDNLSSNDVAWRRHSESLPWQYFDLATDTRQPEILESKCANLGGRGPGEADKGGFAISEGLDARVTRALSITSLVI